MRARGATLALMALLAALTLAPKASAGTYDPVASGQTQLTLAPAFLRLLGSHGVRLSASAPAKLRGATVTFPVSGGLLDPVGVRGSVEHEGALIFTGAKGKLPMKALQLKTTLRRSPLQAKFGGGKLKLAQSSKLATTRSGFGLAAQVSAIALSAKVATRLDKKLGLRGVFAKGQLFGKSSTLAQPASVQILAREKATLELAAGFKAKLASLFVAANPVFPAEHPGPFTFPIAGGKLAPDGSSGTLEAQGAIELVQIGGGQAIVREPWAELGAAASLSAEPELLPSPPLAGRLARLPFLGLSGGALSSEPTSRAIGLAGASVTLTASTAQQLNEAFARPQGKEGVFVAGEALGGLSFVAYGE